MSLRARFRFAHFLVPLAALALLAASFLFAPAWPGGSTSAPKIDPADYGHVRAYDGLLVFTLGPIENRDRRELAFGRVLFTTAGVAIADDDKGTNAIRLQSDVAAGCLFRSQGGGAIVLIAIGRCVPGWAVTSTGERAKQWIRVQATRPKASVVFIKYDPLGG